VKYLITFACYGCHLHGAAPGSVDTTHNVPGTPVLNEDWARAAQEERRMDQPAYHLDQTRGDAVLQAIQEVCGYRGWNLLAAHVRSNQCTRLWKPRAEPERVMHDFQIYASRRLIRMSLDEPNRKRWARHGSTRWLWKPQHVSAAIQYVAAGQGDAMSAFESDES